MWSSLRSVFVAVSASGSGNRVMISSDGVNWAIQATPVDNIWYSVTFAPDLGIFVAVASSGPGNRVMTSYQAVFNTFVTSPVGGDSFLYSEQVHSISWSFGGDDILVDIQLWFHANLVGVYFLLPASPHYGDSVASVIHGRLWCWPLPSAPMRDLIHGSHWRFPLSLEMAIPFTWWTPALDRCMQPLEISPCKVVGDVVFP